jgi:hypothetical protein
VPASISRRAARLTVAVVCALLVGGCGDQRDTSIGAATPTTTTTPAPTTTTLPPMTAEELAWIKAVTTLHKKLDRPFMQAGTLTRAEMTLYANTLRGCRGELTRIGSSSDRLQPVYRLVKKACALYDKGAKCFATAASVSMASGAVEAGTPEERTQSLAIDCGFAAQGNGSNLLADAEAKGEEIKAKAG